MIHAIVQRGYALHIKNGDIALLLHSCITTINKYLAIPEDKILKPKAVVRER